MGSLPGGVLRRLPDDIGGVLVVPQALEPRVVQLPVGRPFAEARLGDQAWLDPVHTGPGQLATVERGTVLLQAGQRRVQAVQRLLAEAGADLAGVDELVTGVVVAQQQRAEPVRVPRGSVKPPMTNSWPLSHLNFSQSPPGRERSRGPAKGSGSARLAPHQFSASAAA